MSMTPRDCWLALLSNQKPDRIPTDYWATPEVTDRLQRELHCADNESLFQKLHIEAPLSLGPKCLHPRWSTDPTRDLWGVRSAKVNYGSGVYEESTDPPLASLTDVEQVLSYAWPNPDDHDWDEFRSQIAQAPRHRIVRAGAYEPFLLYCAMRGMEQAYMDLLAEPDIADAILDRIFDYHFRRNQRIFEIGRGTIDMMYMAEDLGGQTSLLMGMDQIRRFILPNQKRMADLARSFGIHIFYHTDGSAREAIPDLLDVTGIEILNPIQWRCPGMERDGLVRDFGKRVIFHGGIDNQQTLPFGSVEDVRQEVRDCINLFAPARWICAPCHNIQPVTPTANILAMYDTIHQHGRL